MEAKKRGRGRPRLEGNPKVQHYYLGENHIGILERFKENSGFKNISAALRGLLEMVGKAQSSEGVSTNEPGESKEAPSTVEVRACVSCNWETTGAEKWCPECEGKVK